MRGVNARSRVHVQTNAGLGRILAQRRAPVLTRRLEHEDIARVEVERLPQVAEVEAALYDREEDGPRLAPRRVAVAGLLTPAPPAPSGATPAWQAVCVSASTGCISDVQ